MLTRTLQLELIMVAVEAIFKVLSQLATPQGPRSMNILEFTLNFTRTGFLGDLNRTMVIRTLEPKRNIALIPVHQVIGCLITYTVRRIQVKGTTSVVTSIGHKEMI